MLRSDRRKCASPDEAIAAKVCLSFEIPRRMLFVFIRDELRWVILSADPIPLRDDRSGFGFVNTTTGAHRSAQPKPLTNQFKVVEPVALARRVREGAIRVQATAAFRPSWRRTSSRAGYPKTEAFLALCSNKRIVPGEPKSVSGQCQRGRRLAGALLAHGPSVVGLR